MDELITLDLDTISIQYLCKKDKRLAKVIQAIGPISYRSHNDPFEFLVHEIIEQMLSVKAAQQICNRLINLCNGSISPQTIVALTDTELRSIGTSSAKVEYIKNLAKAVLDRKIKFEEFQDMSDEDVRLKLVSLRGIGDWTAKMYLIFVLNRLDILPFEDGAFLQAYRWLYKTNDCSSQSIKKKCQKWKPYSSIAARYLYRALDNGLTKNEFHLYKGV